MELKELLFGEGFVEALENGWKWITIRRGRRDFSPGKLVEAVCAEGDRFILEITSCMVTSAFDVAEKDLRDVGFFDLDDFFAGMRRYYPDLDEYDEVTSIRFQVLARKGAKVFIICPVRDADSDVTREISDYVARLEEAGCEVHWPPRDTNQDDPNGIRICMDNCDAIIAADEVYIRYDPTSRGSHFDMGMVNALRLLGFRKTGGLINSVMPDLDWEGFESFLTSIVSGEEDEIRIQFDPTDKEFLFKGGMIFALLRLGFKKKVVLLNDEDVKETEKKSFANVFRALADGRDIAREDAKCLRLPLAGEVEGWVMKVKASHAD